MILSNIYNLNEYIWVKIGSESQNEFSVPIGVRILRIFNNKLLVIDDDDNELWVDYNDVLKPMHKTSQNYVDDMIKLDDLQEYSILRNLHIRFKQKLIYTYIDVILVAMNPYEDLSIYSDHDIEEYRNKNLNSMPPHIFAVADRALQETRKNSSNQCIVISGESGAGKTESTKFILQYLATINGPQNSVEQQIIVANSIMEAFGNAKTIRNDNSSRFGKYISIYFTEHGKQTARIDQYLLEKSRITTQANGELNFHIFYTLFGMPVHDKKKLELDSSTKYSYLNDSSLYYMNNSVHKFYDILTAMKLLLFDVTDVWNIFKLLAVILHFGNLKIEPTISDNIHSSIIPDELNSNRISNLLKVTVIALKNALTKKTIYINNEKVCLNLSQNAAVDIRDSFVKAIYEKIFLTIISDINNVITFETKQPIGSIGLLDIFGFENFNLNGFEQLCINYANENLQQFFVKHVFKVEQNEYRDEDIIWKDIEFIDNLDVVNLIGHNQLNIMALIDEECKIPNGNDMILMEKITRAHGKNPVINVSKIAVSKIFRIDHYAGCVYYNANGFVEKNRNYISIDIKEMIKQSGNNYLIKLFKSEIENDKPKKMLAVSLQFRNSLDSLMKTLSLCHPFFVRCIKPNELRQPNIFDKSLCVQQLRYSGMLRTAEIRKNGYSVRYFFHDFLYRYKVLSHKINELSDIENVTSICEKYILNTDYQIGRTKVFLKNEDELRASETSTILLLTIKIQRFCRYYIFKRWILKHRRAVILIQKNFRKYLCLKKYRIMIKGFYKLQAITNARHLRRILIKLKKSTIQIQAFWRGYQYRKIYKIVYIDREKCIDHLHEKNQIDEEKYKINVLNWEFITQFKNALYMTALNRAAYNALTGGELNIKDKMYEEYARLRPSNAFVVLFL